MPTLPFPATNASDDWTTTKIAFAPRGLNLYPEFLQKPDFVIVRRGLDSNMADYGVIEAIDKKTGNVNVIIETPKGSRHKYKYDEEKKVFKLSKTMPSGSVFPFDFGFIPSTLAPDDDPLDILVLMEEPVFAGCLIDVRLIGVIKAQQTPKGENMRRNDRLLGVFAKSSTFAEYKTLSDLSNNLLGEIEHFFISYHQIAGNRFNPIGREGVAAAKKILQESISRFAEKK